jgi:hypothetical protein
MKDEARADKREKWKKPGLALDLLAGNTRQALAEFRDLRREVVSLDRHSPCGCSCSPL